MKDKFDKINTVWVCVLLWKENSDINLNKIYMHMFYASVPKSV